MKACRKLYYIYFFDLTDFFLMQIKYFSPSRNGRRVYNA